jgi:hypothetical protein
VICEPSGNLLHTAYCSQSQANGNWLVDQLQELQQHHPLPDRICVFRPQTFQLLEAVSQRLHLTIEPTRRTPGLKTILQDKARLYPTLPNYNGQAYEPLALDRPPPVPLPENLWGDRWRFASLPAASLIDSFRDRPIPVLDMPEALFPLKLGLASTIPVPGVVIDGGRQSLRLVRWLQEVHPVELNYIAGEPDGLILEAGLIYRWILATFSDPEVTASARQFTQRKQASKGLHFLLVQPDDSGMTFTGFWLLNSLAA